MRMIRVISGPAETLAPCMCTGLADRGRGIGELANRKLRLGLSRCKLVFLEAVFTSREGCGTRAGADKRWWAATSLRWALLMRAIK
jgi:hypothetical protein